MFWQVIILGLNLRLVVFNYYCSVLSLFQLLILFPLQQLLSFYLLDYYSGLFLMLVLLLQTSLLFLAYFLARLENSTFKHLLTFYISFWWSATSNQLLAWHSFSILIFFLFDIKTFYLRVTSFLPPRICLPWWWPVILAMSWAWTSPPHFYW